MHMSSFVLCEFETTSAIGNTNTTCIVVLLDINLHIVYKCIILKRLKFINSQ